MSIPAEQDVATRTRVEQIKLIYALVGLTVAPAIAVAVVLYFALVKDQNQTTLRLWLLGIIVCKLFQGIDARRRRNHTYTATSLKCETARLMVIHGVDALLWTLLSWIALDSSAPTQAVLIIAVLTGIVGGAVSLMSPVLVVFVTYALVDLCVLVPRFLFMHDTSFTALALCSPLYFGALWMLARNSNIATKQSIQLRFENLELTRDLQLEAEKSKTAYAEVIEANVAKSRFIAAASHDLRQPIHALGLFLEVLSLNNKQPEQKPVIDNSRSAAKATSEMLNTLLDFSRIEAGVVKPEFKAFALQDVFRSIEAELASQADEKRISYRTRDTDVVCYSDPAIVELILRNLISNAIRYTHQGGVLVGCRRKRQHFSIEVWDTGIGVGPGDSESIFKEFYQIGNHERDRRKGLGLGLSIARRLSDSIGSKLVLQSVSGRGSVFRLLLPSAVPASLPESMAEAVIPAPALSAHILVVDDDESVRQGMTALLERWGYTCTAVGSLEDAVESGRAQVPDLIISDLRLRDPVNGIAAIGQLRNQLGKHVRALVITGETEPGMLIATEASGLLVLHKPVLGGRLASAIAEALADQPPGLSASA